MSYASYEVEGRYDVLINVDDELLFCLRARTGAPAQPRILYDGGRKAVLIRDGRRSVVLDHLPPKTREALLNQDKALVAEIKEETLRYEYFVPVMHVKKIPV